MTVLFPDFNSGPSFPTSSTLAQTHRRTKGHLEPTRKEIADRWRRIDGPFTDRELAMHEDIWLLLWRYRDSA